jgi:hypothetical protein
MDKPMNELASRWFGKRDSAKKKKDEARAAATPAGARQSITWEVVETAPGITVANIIAGRLQTAGFTVRVWQEAAGQALGLTVGALGTAHIAVPDEQADEARRLLETEVED